MMHCVRSYTRGASWLALVAAALWCVAVAGCDGQTGGQAGDEFDVDTASDEAIFDNVIGSLLSLDARVDMGISTEARIVSDQTTTDQEPAMAIVKESRPGSGQFDVVEVVSGNAQFVSNEVRADDNKQNFKGDRVRFTFEPIQLTPEEKLKLQQQGKKVPEGRPQYYFNISKVIDENHVQVHGGFANGSNQPVMIEVLRTRKTREEHILKKFKIWIETGAPALVWHPSPDDAVLQQMINRLNQWSSGFRAKPAGAAEWTEDTLIDALEPRLRELPQYKQLGQSKFEYEDGRLMQEAVWLRDIASSVTAVGEYPGLEDVALQQAYKLFDWVVRHVQLDDSGSVGIRYNRPWLTLLYGVGTAEQRAWAFMLLARQKGLEVVVLTPKSSGDEEASRTGFLCGLLLDDKIYLFDTMLGMPVPGPKGRGIATLREAISDPSILDLTKLLSPPDSPPTTPYYSAADLKSVDAWIECSPIYLARRTQEIEQQLVGSQRFVLSARPAATARVASAHANVASAKPSPAAGRALLGESSFSATGREAVAKRFELFAWRPSLWKARVLQFQGIYNNVSPDESDEGFVHSQGGAKSYYLDGRKTKAYINRTTRTQVSKNRWTALRDYAAYWLALILMDENNWPEAEDWLSKRVLEDGIFKHGAQYNLARCWEASGRIGDAIAAYDKDTTSPQSFGNRLRAKWLRLLHPDAKPTPMKEETKVETKPADDAKSDEG